VNFTQNISTVFCGILQGLRLFYLQKQRQVFQIGTVRYAEGLWCMRRHGLVIAHCTDSEDFPKQIIRAMLWVLIMEWWQMLWGYYLQEIVTI